MIISAKKTICVTAILAILSAARPVQGAFDYSIRMEATGHIGYSSFVDGIHGDDPIDYDFGPEPVKSHSYGFQMEAQGSQGSSNQTLNRVTAMGIHTISMDCQSFMGGAATFTGGSVFGNGEWLDTLDLVSPSLPDGTPIDIALRLGLDISLAEGGRIYDTNVVMAIFNGYTGGPKVYEGETWGGSQWEDESIVLAKIGTPFNISGWIQGGVGTMADVDYRVSTAVWNATATYALEILTPDVTYTARSGTVYPTEIPEPATLSLLLAGGAILARRRTRRRRRLRR